MTLQQLLPGSAPRPLMKARILCPAPEGSSMAPLSTSSRLTLWAKGQPRWSCRTLNPTPLHHQGSKERSRALPGLAGHLGDELCSLPSDHGEARGRIVPSSEASPTVCNLSRGLNQPETSFVMRFERYKSFTSEFFFFIAEEAAAETLLRGLPLLISVPAILIFPVG